jgi:hypothetical protein
VDLSSTGGRPWRPSAEELPGAEHTITSNEVFHMETLPKRMLIALMPCNYADYTLVYRRKDPKHETVLSLKKLPLRILWRQCRPKCNNLR